VLIIVAPGLATSKQATLFRDVDVVMTEASLHANARITKNGRTLFAMSGGPEEMDWVPFRHNAFSRQRRSNSASLARFENVESSRTPIFIGCAAIQAWP